MMQHIEKELSVETQAIVSVIENNLDTTGNANIESQLQQNKDDIISLLPVSLIYTHTLHILNENRVIFEYSLNNSEAAPISVSMPISKAQSIDLRTYALNEKMNNAHSIFLLILFFGGFLSVLGAMLMCLFKRSVTFNDEIKKAQNFNKTIMDNIPDILFVKDKNFKIVNANKHFLHLFPEDKRDKIIGYTTVEEFEEREAQEFLAEDKKAFDFGYSKTIETLLFPDKKTRTLSTQKVRFEDDEGEEFILGIANDITEQITIQRDLEKSQAFLRMVIDYFPGLLFVKDENSKIVYANDQFKSMYPQDKQDKIIGYTTFEDYPNNQKENFFRQDQEAFREGYIEELTQITYPNGEVRDVTVKKVCFADSYGDQYLLCVTSENVKEK